MIAQRAYPIGHDDNALGQRVSRRMGLLSCSWPCYPPDKS